MRLFQRVVSVVLEGILLGFLDRNNIGADNILFPQELRYHYILRPVDIVLIYLKLAAYRFSRCMLLTVVVIYWRFDREDFLLCTLRLPAERMLRERSSL
jgi:hypothetical protein